MKHRLSILMPRMQIILLGFEWWYLLLLAFISIFIPMGLIEGSDRAIVEQLRKVRWIVAIVLVNIIGQWSLL